MSALAMILAAVAVSGSGPEKVSGEVGPAPLILDGTWMGTITYEDKQIRDVILFDHHIIESSWSRVAVSSWEMKDEGYGKFRVAFFDDDYLGIYEWRDDCVTLCIRRSAKDGQRPFEQATAKTSSSSTASSPASDHASTELPQRGRIL